MIWDFSGISAALAWNSSNILIHSRNALEMKPTEVASVYSSQSEIIHVLLSHVRSWRKLSTRIHWHIFGAFHTSQWNYTRNMNLAHTACARCAVCTGHTHTHTHTPQQTLPLKFRNKPFKTLLCDSLHDCVLCTFLRNEWVFCEFYRFAKIFDLGLVGFSIEVFEISVIVMIAVCNRN